MRGSSGSWRAGEHAIGGDAGAFDGLRGEDRTAALVEDIDHLLDAGDFGVDDVVGENDSEGLVAYQFFGAENGVAEAERLVLANVADAGQGRDTA